MRKRMNLVGKRYGRLIVTKRAKDSVSESGYTMPRWVCLCDCGNKKIVRQQKLLQGSTSSCGCLRKEISKEHASNLNRVFDIDKYIKERISVDKETGCWEWKGGFFSSGYARAGLKGFSKRASRMVYTFLKGDIPEGLLMCHTCDNPKCVNPDHLFLGTTKDNLSDMVNKGRSLKGETNYNAILTEKIVQKIRSSSRSVEYLSKRFKVSVSTIKDVLKRRTWKHV